MVMSHSSFLPVMFNEETPEAKGLYFFSFEPSLIWLKDLGKTDLAKYEGLCQAGPRRAVGQGLH